MLYAPVQLYSCHAVAKEANWCGVDFHKHPSTTASGNAIQADYKYTLLVGLG